MPGKARVHELARELGMESKNVLSWLKENGEFVKSASSTVEAPVARKLREAFPAAPSAPAPSAPASHTQASACTTQKRVSSGGTQNCSRSAITSARSSMTLMRARGKCR